MNFCFLCVPNVQQSWGEGRGHVLKRSPSAGEFVPVDALVIWVVLVDAVRPRAADGSPEKALFGSAAREENIESRTVRAAVRLL